MLNYIGCIVCYNIGLTCAKLFFHRILDDVHSIAAAFFHDLRVYLFFRCLRWIVIEFSMMLVSRYIFCTSSFSISVNTCHCVYIVFLFLQAIYACENIHGIANQSVRIANYLPLIVKARCVCIHHKDMFQ